MGWVEIHRRLVGGELRGLDRLFAAGLTPLEWIYGAGVMARTLGYDLGLLPSRRPPRPWSAVCVGSLAAGGTGKTPFAALLARRLRAAGLRPLLVSKGYGAPQRDPAPRLISPGRLGRGIAEGWETASEEAILLATLAPEVPVAVAARYVEAAGVAAGTELPPDMLVLDGGFQHRSLEVDGRFVLIDASHRPEDGRLLPRGELREPWGALRRADWIVLHRFELCPDASDWERHLARHARGKAILRCENRFGMPYELTATGPGARQVWADLIGRRLGVWTAVGNPQSFLRGLERVGVRPIWQWLARDHAPVGPRVIETLAQAAREKRIRAFLVTQKDAVKLAAHVDHLPPVLVVPAEPVPLKSDAPVLDEAVGALVQRHWDRAATASQA